MPLAFRRSFCAAIAILLATIPSSVFAGGVLDEVREEVEDDDRDDDSSSDWDSDCDDPRSELMGILLTPVRIAVTAPWWLPYTALEDNWDTWPEFPAGPYADSHQGYLLIESPYSTPTRAWSARVTALYGTDFGDLSWAGTRIVVDTASRFGVDSSWTQWIEQRPAGDDSLATGDFNFVLRFAQSEHVQFYSGLGANWMADDGHGDAGFNFTYGLDWFPKRPWVISASLDAGTLGGARLYHGQLGIGAAWRHVELFTGYDATFIGDATLDGLIAGIRLWF
jgi:hypothetical protein